MTFLDFAPAIGALGSLALVAFTAAVPGAVYWARKHWKLQLTAQQTQAIIGAADKGAELAYGFLVANATHFADVPMRNAAIASGVNHVLASVPQALSKLGITPDHVHDMVSARLGGLLAKDPTVSIAPPKPASAPTASPPEKPAS